jgi:hypothetical protein
LRVDQVRGVAVVHAVRFVQIGGRMAALLRAFHV